MDLVLYNLNISTCSQKVRMCLAEKQLSYSDRQVNLAGEEHLSPEYLAINPNGVVPTLIVDGEPVIDSSVICEFLEETFPEPALAPGSPMGKARMRAWMRYLEEIPTKAIRVPSFNLLFGGKFDSASLKRAAAKRPLREELYLEMGTDGFDDAKISAALKLLRQTVERVDDAVGNNGPWLCGEQFTIADIVLVPTIVRMEDLGHSAIWRDLPHFTDWYVRIQDRPSFAHTYPPGSRLKKD